MYNSYQTLGVIINVFSRRAVGLELLELTVFARKTFFQALNLRLSIKPAEQNRPCGWPICVVSGLIKRLKHVSEYTNIFFDNLSQLHADSYNKLKDSTPLTLLASHLINVNAEYYLYNI